jgi:hypothetical protein
MNVMIRLSEELSFERIGGEFVAVNGDAPT